MKISVLDDGKHYQILEYVVIVGRRLETEEEIVRLVRSCDTA